MILCRIASVIMGIIVMESLVLNAMMLVYLVKEMNLTVLILTQLTLVEAVPPNVRFVVGVKITVSNVIPELIE